MMAKKSQPSNGKWTSRIVGMGEEPPDQLMANPANFRIHPAMQQAALEGSLDTLGWVQQVLVNKRTGNVIDGHLRVALALRHSQPLVPVLYVDLNEDEERQALLSLDPVAAMAATDRDKLDALLRSVQSDDERVQAMMKEIAERERIPFGEQPPEDPGAQIDRAEELREKWGVESGQLWEVGRHRIICGDCTDRAVVERVMGGEKARMIFTDPPYGIGKEIINDNLKREDWINFYRLFTEIMLDYIIDNAYVYVWGYFETLSDYWQEIIKARGDCNFRNFIIWKKSFIQGRNAEEFRQFPENYEAALLFIFGMPFQNGPWSTSPNAEYYPEIFESIRAYLDNERIKAGWSKDEAKRIAGHSDKSFDHWFGHSQWTIPTREVYQKWQEASRGDAFRKEYDAFRKEYDELRGYFDNTHGFTDIWEFDNLSTSKLHPTVKPVEVCERGIITTSQVNEVVLDVFLGSGSTLVACERLGRIGRGVEISPAYVAVSLQRLADMGLEPKLVDTYGVDR